MKTVCKKRANSNGHCLTAQEIRDTADLPIERVETPEWGKGNYVFVRTQTGKERDAHEVSMMNAKGKLGDLNNIRARVAVRVVCDADMKPLFTKADADWLGEKSCAALDRVFGTYQRLNHMSDDDVEAIAKNSEGAPSAASGSS